MIRSYGRRRSKFYKIMGIIMSIISGIVWSGTIGVLFLRWGLEDFIRYDSDDGEIVYISNVGAAHKSGFILGTVTTGVPFFLTVIFTKFYYDLIVQRRSKKVVSLISLICVLISSLSLILLSILDSLNHKSGHYTFVGLFVIFILISAILHVIYRFNKSKQNIILIIRVLLIGMFISLVICFVVLGLIGGKGTKSNLKSVAACIEWSLAILFALYLVLFAFDLLFYN